MWSKSKSKLVFKCVTLFLIFFDIKLASCKNVSLETKEGGTSLSSDETIDNPDGNFSRRHRPKSSNFTASVILLQKIKESKEKESDLSISKKQQLLRTRPKFVKVGSSRGSPDPSSAPPLIAATGTLLLLNEHKGPDWSKKHLGSKLQPRSKNYKEKLKKDLKKQDNNEEEESQILPDGEISTEPESEVETTQGIPLATATTETPFLSLEKVYVDQFTGKEGPETPKSRRRISQDLDPVKLDPKLQGIRVSSPSGKVNEQELTTVTVSDLYLDDIIIAGIEETLGKDVPFDTKLRYKVPGSGDPDVELPNNLFRYTLVDSSTGVTHTRVESKESSGVVHGYYDVQDKECKRLHYKADTVAGFRALKVENKSCETSGRQPRLHDGSELKSTPFKETSESDVPIVKSDTSSMEKADNQNNADDEESKEEKDYEIEEDEVIDPDGAILQETTVLNSKVSPFAALPQTVSEPKGDSPSLRQVEKEDITSKRKAEGSELFHPVHPSTVHYAPFPNPNLNNQLWNPPTSPHQLFGFSVHNGLGLQISKTLHPDLIAKPHIVSSTTQLPNISSKNVSTTFIPHQTIDFPATFEDGLHGEETSYDPFEFHSVHKLVGDLSKPTRPMTSPKPPTSTPRIITTLPTTINETSKTPPPTTITTSIKAEEADPVPTEITVQVQGTDVTENQIPSIADGDNQEDDNEEENADKDFDSSSNKDEDFTMKRLRQNRLEPVLLNGITVTPHSSLPDPSNQVRPSSKPIMADVQSQFSSLPELKRVAKSSTFTSGLREDINDEDENFGITRNMLMNIILRPGGGDKSRALPRPQVDVKSEGNNVIIVKMTFPSNENIQGLKAFAPTETDDLRKFDAVHDAIGQSAKIEKIHASSLENSPDFERKERQINPDEDFFLPSPKDSGKKSLLEGYDVTETRPTTPIVTPVPANPSPTPHFIETASFPLEYFTQNEVISPKNSQVFNHPKPVHPILFPTAGNGHFGSVAFFQHPQQQLALSIKRKRNTPPPRPLLPAMRGMSYPPQPLAYPGFF